MVCVTPSLEAEAFAAFEAYIDRIVGMILAGEHTHPLRRASRSEVANDSGLYALYDNMGLIYVGESGCLRERFGDLFETRHHTLRRKLGAKLFGAEAGFQPATTKRCFSADQETRLTIYMESALKYLAVPTAYCRSEIEERVVSIRPGLLNARGRRGT